MIVCARCNTQFQYKCRLVQHLKRVSPCEQVNETDTMCTYCLCVFATSKSAKRHSMTCKQKYDSVRQMELTLGIPIDQTKQQQTVCRFCTREFSRISNMYKHQLSCKKKVEYAGELQQRINEQTNTAQNITNNTNNGVINIHVTQQPHAFGKENMNYITKEYVMRLWETSNRVPEMFVSKLITSVHMNPSHPENHNVIYTNARSNHARVFNGASYELQYIDDIIAQASTNSLDHMMDELYDPNTNSPIGTIMNGCDIVETGLQSKRELIRQARLMLYNACPRMKRTQLADAMPLPVVNQ